MDGLKKTVGINQQAQWASDELLDIYFADLENQSIENEKVIKEPVKKISTIKHWWEDEIHIEKLNTISDSNTVLSKAVNSISANYYSDNNTKNFYQQIQPKNKAQSVRSYNNIYENPVPYEDAFMINENDLYPSDNTYTNRSNKSIEKDKCVYRAHLCDNKTYIAYIACPEDFKGTSLEAYNNCDKNVKGFYSVEGVDNKNEILKPKRLLKKQLFKKTIKVVTKEEFYKNTNDKFTFKYGNLYLGDKFDHYNNNHFHNTLEQKRCEKNVPVSFINNHITYFGITTGIFNNETGEVDIIATELNNHDGYVSKRFIKIKQKYNRLATLGTHPLSREFYRLKITNTVDSSSLFGFKNEKKKMEGMLINPDNFKVIRNYYCKKLDLYVDIVEIKKENSNSLKFLITDVEFLGINPDNFTNVKVDKIIKIGSKVRIFDDRKIKLVRNQEVVVTNIKLDKICGKNTLVHVKDNEGAVHTVLIKQLRCL